MFDSWGAAGSAAGNAAGGSVGVLPDGAAADESASAGLAGMAPGAALAGAVERLVAPLLAPSPSPVIGSGTAGASGSTDGVIDACSAGAGLFADVVDPGERALVEAAESLVVNDDRSAYALADLGADGLSELVAACGRLAAWAQWAQSVAAVCLARCPEMCGLPWRPSRGDDRCGERDRDGREPQRGGDARAVSPGDLAAGRWNASGEIACRLGVSRTRASRLVDRGAGLVDERLAPTSGLHRVGLLDESKTGLLVRRLAEEPAGVVETVQARVLGRAVHRTSAQLGRDVDRALTALDPDGVSRRARRNTFRRHVSRPRQAGAGVCEMRLLMPRADAFLVDATLDAIAASARAAGDERTTGQLRADALVALSLHALRAGQHRAAGQRATGPIAADDDAAAESAVDAATADLMPDGVPLAELLAALSGLVSHAGPWWMPSGTDPIALPPGLTVHVDVTVPMDHLAALLDESSSGPPGGNAPDGRLLGSAGPPGDSLDAAGMPDSEPLDEPPDIGSSGDPRACAPLGEASLGAGGRSMPVPAAVARALAAGGTWRRLITDPIVGTVVDVGRTRYRPPAGLADLVRARDRVCTHPGCEVPARGCDLDHITPWASGGTTSLENLTCLCRAHHRLKHTPGWALTRTGDGALIWRTPTGARYRREPDGAIALLPRRTGPRQAVASAVRVPDALARAVTPAVLDRLDKGLADPHIADGAAGSVAAPGCVAADVAATGGGESAPVITTRGPRPGENPGDYETTPYPRALHALGLTPLLDAIPPF